MCRGYAQSTQKELLAEFAESWYERIERLVEKAAWSQSRYIYVFTQPKLYATEVEKAKFSALLTKC